MKINFRVPTSELIKALEEAVSFLKASKNLTSFKRIAVNNQVVEEGLFVFDFYTKEGFDHQNQKWSDGAATTLEISLKKSPFCPNSIAPTITKTKDGE